MHICRGTSQSGFMNEDSLIHKTFELKLTRRSGELPQTTTPRMPHSQVSQNAGQVMYDKLAMFCFTLDAVEEKPSGISIRGARALSLRKGIKVINRKGFLINREFAHIHPLPDASMHLILAPEHIQEVIDKGWGELHPIAESFNGGLLMIFGPRNDEELETIKEIILASYHYVSGRIK
ncbi:MAG: hypothetical protein IH946_11920 [Bacteroidetes bacterium]|nr:hypothetical protein [Bacteroidota bacterium]